MLDAMKPRSRRFNILPVVLATAALGLGEKATAAAPSWKAGTARVAITPKEPMWMAGYAARTKPSEGAVHDLWAKALALEDPAGHRVLLITLDVCGIDRDLSNRVRDDAQKATRAGAATGSCSPARTPIAGPSSAPIC